MFPNTTAPRLMLVPPVRRDLIVDIVFLLTPESSLLL